MQKGVLKSWRRDKGYGFIKVDNREKDVFVHISTLRAAGRPPRIGDIITFDIETQQDGKQRAINCTIKRGKNKTKQGAKNKISIIVAILVVIALVVGYLYIRNLQP